MAKPALGLSAGDVLAPGLDGSAGVAVVAGVAGVAGVEDVAGATEVGGVAGVAVDCANAGAVKRTVAAEAASKSLRVIRGNPISLRPRGVLKPQSRTIVP